MISELSDARPFAPLYRGPHSPQLTGRSYDLLRSMPSLPSLSL
jgi:hypothetical protein